MGVRDQEMANAADLTSTVDVEWVTDEFRDRQPSLSIVIPSYNGLDHLRVCLPALRDTLPHTHDIEVIVVDDGSTDRELSGLLKLAGPDGVRVVHNATNVGFLESCNIGAAEADGEVIVFLNNDTVPMPGWLPPLLRTLRRYPEAGAVGGKLVYPDGRLQEAGGIVFSDASGANFGRGSQDLEEPLYNYVREVDYCSGALLATRRSVFFEVGGFDRRYSPAYFEDSDYCFKLRSMGYRVYFQPESVVVHLEGGSGGTDESRGVKRYQRLNRRKFREKWKDELKRRPPNPQHWNVATLHRLAVRDEPGERIRRALVCAPLMPAYDRESGGQSILDLVLYLREAGWAVSYVAENPSGDGGARYAGALRQAGVATYGGFGVRTDELIEHGRFDVAIFAFWYVAEQLMPRVRALSPSTRVAVNTMDLHFLRNARRAFERRAGTGGAVLLDEAYASEFVRELNTYARADACFAVSENEADLINQLVGDPELAYVVSDYEYVTSSPYPFADRRGILFVGNFRHPPNVEAVEYLCRKILPRLDSGLLEQHPIIIVGNALDGRVKSHTAGLPHVRAVGWVPSILPYLQRARVAVTPLLHGAGTKRKQLQALMAGTPSVSTTIGVEGFDLRPGEDVLVADDPEIFAQAVTRLVTDAKLWHKVARNGQASVAPLYGRDAVQRRFLDVLAAVLAKEPKDGLDSAAERTSGSPKDYRALVHRVRERVAELVPAGSVVAIASKGDDELLRLRDRSGWHFPRAEGGAYGGYYPVDSAAAISHVEQLRAAGAQFLVFPAPAFWWLEHYTELAQHLERNHREVFRDEETCLIFGL